MSKPCRYCAASNAANENGEHWIVRSIIPARIDIRRCTKPKPKAKCAGCGAEQPYGRIRCDVCGEPLVFPVSFVCPRCEAESFNLNDIVEGYCGRCHAFAGDPLPASLRRAKSVKMPKG